MMKNNTNEQTNPNKNIGRLIRFAKTKDFYEGEYESGAIIHINILSAQIIRIQVSQDNQFNDYPKPLQDEHNAQITVKLPAVSTTIFRKSTLLDTAETCRIKFGRYTIVLKKRPALIGIYDEYQRRFVMQEKSPLMLTDTSSIQTLAQNESEFYFGGGAQNGHFSHKGETIKIANTNSWGPDGVASPNPFFWSNSGFGILRNTWMPGKYDFGETSPQTTILQHDDAVFDSFYLLGDTPADLLNNYYRLTGFPILLPKFAFYPAHIGNFNHQAWTETSAENPSALKFADEKYYARTSPRNATDETQLASFNGDQDNYQFSARAMIENYQKRDLPLGWFLPNDGFSGLYNYKNKFIDQLHSLEAFSNYANKRGVKVGLLTKKISDAKAAAELTQEIQAANISFLKTDFSLIKQGYSFGLSGILAANKLFSTATNKKIRPFILTLNGWAGTQKHAAVLTGEQVGGTWTNIQNQIPTLIGASLSGLPNIGSGVDGALGGDNAEVNVRDYQWKTFTPLLFNLDGRSAKSKTPFAFGRRATQINRAYLKLRTEFLPYHYSLAHQALSGDPIVRAMFIEFPHEKINYTAAVKYQFMFGPNLLIAPIYNNHINNAGDSIRNHLYLPDSHQPWIDFFTGKQYMGGAVYDNLVYPHWHLPVFVKAGAIIPFAPASNNSSEEQNQLRQFNFYPHGKSSFELIEDDGKTNDYLVKKYAQTKISSELKGSKFEVTIDPTTGTFADFNKEKTTYLNIMVDEHPGKITLEINDQEVVLPEVKTKLEFEQNEQGFYYNENFNPSEFFAIFNVTETTQKAIQIKLPKLDITRSTIKATIMNLSYGRATSFATIIDSTLPLPKQFIVDTTKATDNSLTLTWKQNFAQEDYEISINDQRHTNIRGTSFTFDELNPNTIYRFKIRSKIGTKVSDWTEEILGRTKEKKISNLISNIQISSNISAQPGHELSNLIDQNEKTEWITAAKPSQIDSTNQKYLELTFSFDQIHQLLGLTYLPSSLVKNGTITELALSFSADGLNWSTFSHPISWRADNTPKKITLKNTRAKAVKIRVLASTSEQVSGREILFFKNN